MPTCEFALPTCRIILPLTLHGRKSDKAEIEGEAKEPKAPAEPTPEELERKAAAEERRRQDEEDAKLMTLEQYQAAQAAKRAAAAAVPARKANEGVDESQWKTKKFERKEDDDVFYAGKVGLWNDCGE